MKNKKASFRFVEHEPSMLPQINQFIENRWWTILEAAFVLSGFPEYGISMAFITPNYDFPSDILEDRPFFYLPSHFHFNPENYSKSFQIIFRELNKDIHNKKIPSREFFVDEGIHNLVKPCEVILWAINKNWKNYNLPSDLQNALSIKQNKQRQTSPWLDKVKGMIVAQYCKLDNPNMTQDEIINSALMKNYGKNFEAQYQTIQDLNFKVRADVRRQLKKDISAALGSTKCFRIRCIPEALIKRKSYFECDFELLDSIISTCVNIVSYEKMGLESIQNMNMAEFIDIMMKDKIIKMYLKNAPLIIEQFIKKRIRKIYWKFGELLWHQAFKGLPETWQKARLMS
jgi:hypothetical protein